MAFNQMFAQHIYFAHRLRICLACPIWKCYSAPTTSMQRTCYSKDSCYSEKFGEALITDNPLHASAFISGTLQPTTDKFVRGVGRPRHEWQMVVRDRACQLVGGHEAITRRVQDLLVWKSLVMTPFLSTRRPGL